VLLEYIRFHGKEYHLPLKSYFMRRKPGCNTKGWKKEKKEHPWATKGQAKKIACDHNKKKR
jgi:hypothetical protein